tara:strand:+ start:254 stop:691 length:438 start_codon:yes stop_codon:yes gene_type:complete
MKDKLIPLDIYINNYVTKWRKNIYPVSTKYPFFNYFINFLHTIFIIFTVFGIFLPPKYLKYHLANIMIMLGTWYILRCCWMTLIIKKLDINNPEDKDFFPLTKYTRYTLILLLLIISFIGYINPELSLFRLTFKFMTYISNRFDN